MRDAALSTVLDILVQSRRERQMKRFKSARHVQRFLSAHDQASNLFHLRRHRLPAAQYRAARAQALRTWAEITGVAAAA